MASIVPMLMTSDIEKLRDFYETLGFTQRNAWFDGGVLSWMELEFLGTTIMLQVTDRKMAEATQSNIELYFVCDDVDGLIATWRRRGVQVPDASIAFYGMRQLFIRDPDNRRICFESAIQTSHE